MILDLQKNKHNIKTENIILEDLFLGTKVIYLNTHSSRYLYLKRLVSIHETLALQLKLNSSLEIDRDRLKEAYNYIVKKDINKSIDNTLLLIQPLVKDCIFNLNIFRNNKFDKKKIFDANYLDYIEFSIDKDRFFSLKMIVPHSINFGEENPDFYTVNNLFLEVLISLYLEDKINFSPKNNFDFEFFIEFFKLGILSYYNLPLPTIKRKSFKNNTIKYYPFYPGFGLAIKEENYNKIIQNTKYIF